MVIRHVLHRQAGVLTVAQAVECGISPRTVRRRVRAGEWTVLLPGVLLVGGHRRTDEARVRAAWLWAGGASATVGGVSAAYWHGMVERAPEKVEVTIPRQRRLQPQPGVILRRRDLPDRDRVGVRHLWVTGKPLTALEAAVALPDGSTFLDRALQRHVRWDSLYRAYCRNLGRRGSPAQRALIGAAGDRAESEAERLLVAMLRESGVSGWTLGHPLGPYWIDVAFPSERVAIEVDGWAWHVDAMRFRADRRKGNAIVRAGWTLLRFTWHDLHGRPGDCLVEIVETVGRQRRPA